MKAVVVFESMYGNTRAIAESVAKGIQAAGDARVTVAPVSKADSELFREADFLVVGGPTHAHGMSHLATPARGKRRRDEAGPQRRCDPSGVGCSSASSSVLSSRRRRRAPAADLPGIATPVR